MLQLPVGDISGKNDRVLQTQLPGQLLQMLPLGSLPDDQEAEGIHVLLLQPAHSLQEKGDVLLLFQPGHGAEQIPSALQVFPPDFSRPSFIRLKKVLLKPGGEHLHRGPHPQLQDLPFHPP